MPCGAASSGAHPLRGSFSWGTPDHSPRSLQLKILTPTPGVRPRAWSRREQRLCCLRKTWGGSKKLGEEVVRTQSYWSFCLSWWEQTILGTWCLFPALVAYRPSTCPLGTPTSEAKGMASTPLKTPQRGEPAHRAHWWSMDPAYSRCSVNTF